MSGWIKLHRKFHTWEWRHKPEMVSLFIHMLTSAAYEQSKWQGIELERGQVVFGRHKWAEKLGISEKSLRTCLERLKSTNEVAIKTTNKFSVITIVKYDEYQFEDEERASKTANESANKGPTKGQQRATYKEVKELKKEDKTTRGTRFTLTSLSDDWKKFCNDYRPDLDPMQVFDEFRDYWIAAAGARGLKLDWFATWRNWVRGRKPGTKPVSLRPIKSNVTTL